MSNRKQPNVLLIGIDTLRADHLGCYGYDQPTSPFLDDFCHGAVRFSQCISHAPWTIPSFTSILSGLDPIRHRVVASPWNIPNYAPVHFDDLMPTLAEMLRDAGYLTFAVDNLIDMGSHPAWFVRGFGHYVNLTDRGALRHHHVLAAQVTDAFLGWQGWRDDGAWFGFLHYWDPHLPYNYPRSYNEVLDAYRPISSPAPDGRPYLPRRGYAEEISDGYLELIAQYDRSIRYVDTEIGRLLAALEHTGALDNTIVVLTGDHGEAMVEHGVLFEHSLLYDPTIHVPLIVRAPGGHLGGQVSNDIVQHHDIVPTILALAGLPEYRQSTGSVLPPFASRPTRRHFAVSQQDGGAALRAVRTEDRKLICHYDLSQSTLTRPARVERYELYDLTTDPHELNDIADVRPNEVAELAAILETWRTAMLDGQALGDPLLDSAQRIDFANYPGDPVLVEFYRSLPSQAPR
jgi:arylsulfatase A-like enzyme